MTSTLPPDFENESAAAAGPGPRSMRLGEILVDRKKIEAEDLERALEIQKERGDKLGKILVDMGLIAQRDVLAALSDQLGIPVVTLDNPPPSAPEIDGLSHRFLRQCRAFPVALVDSTLTIAMADPLDFETIAAVRAFSGLQIQTVLAAEQEILDAIEKHYGEGEQHALLGEGEDEQAMADLEHLRDMASEAPVIRLVNAMIADALEKRSSDIHIEPFEKEFRVRFRVDGVLFAQEPPPRELKAAIISRLKLMAKLNIAERRLPQDGRIKSGWASTSTCWSAWSISPACRTASFWSPGPPAAANPPPSIRRSNASTFPTRRSSPSKIRWSIRWTGSTRSTSTRRSA